MSKREFFLVHLLDDFSGSPKVLAEFAKVLVSEGEKVTALTGTGSTGFLSKESIEHKKFYYQRYDNKFILLFSFFFSQLCLFFVMSYNIIKSYINGNKSVVVVNTILPFSAALAAKLLRSKVIYYCHEVSIRPRELHDFLFFFCKKTANNVIFVSKYVSNRLSFDSRETVKNVVYNPTSLHFENVSLTNDELYAKWQAKKVLMLCSLKDYKGIPEFIKLAKENIETKCRCDFQLVVNDTQENLDSYLQKYELPDNISFFCQPDNIIDLYVGAFVVVNLSCPNKWVETFGLTLIEGMSCYCPVIGPNVGGPVEIIQNDINGYSIDSRSPEINYRINLLANDFQLWSDFSMAAKKRSQDFSYSEYARNIMVILSE